MGRTQDLRIVDPVLTNLARGYSNSAFVGTVLFPVANVFKEAGKIPSFGKESFKVYDTERAIRAKSNVLPVESRTNIDFVLTEHDAVYPLDYREIAEDVFNARQYGSYQAQQTIMLKHERTCAALANNLAIYPTGNKVTLSGTSQFTSAGSDPIGVIRTGIEAIRQKIAKRPNTMVIGASSFKALQDHASIIERIKYSMKGIVTVDLLQAIFDIPKIVIGDSMYLDGDVLKDNWGDNIILAYVPGAQPNGAGSVYEPSFGYTLRKSGYPQVDTYFEEGGKMEKIRSTDNLTVKIVGSEAGYIISDTNG
jgi:hypothetical protein